MRRAGGGVEVLHTLNGTATAIGRTLIAIIENHQQADGSVALPSKLYPYLPESIRLLRPKA
jgi:seryl-tRNA synthetase